MTNLEQYKNEIIRIYGENFKNLGDTILDFMSRLEVDKNKYYKDGAENEGAMIINWLCDEYNEVLLTFDEKKYLAGVIEPFKDNIVSISKTSCVVDQYGVFYECINIACKNSDIAKLPSFPKGSCYKGMQANHEYSLDELKIKI